MFPNRFAFAALALACVAAAGAGSYLATRQGVPAAAEPTLAAAAPITATGTQPVETTELPVQETEAVVGDRPQPAAQAPAAVELAPAQPRRRADTAARPASRPARTSPASTARNSAQPQPPALEQTWPNSASSEAPPSVAATDPVGTPERDEAPVVETQQVVEPPQKTFEELVVSADSVIGLQTDRTMSSERARVEDSVEARVARDVRVDGQVAIPAGTRAVGSVMVVERGGKFKERARLGLRFHTLVMADGTRLPITTETVYRFGDAPGNGSAAKIGGGAVAGAILGAIIGGGKGAAVGAATGAGAGTAAAATGNRSEAIFPAGAEVTARILAPVTVTLEK
ncbi:MAG: hypothetical protein GEU82_05705 [Luteitalea sp.]|nr:hypothetical protein [Luteitalea sp.]